MQEGAGDAFTQIVDCITLNKAGLLYVCDREGDRMHVVEKSGNFIRNIWIRTSTETLPDPRGSAWGSNSCPILSRNSYTS